MTENVIMALIDKLPYGWLVFFIIIYFCRKDVIKGYNCLENLYKKYLAKELARENKYKELIQDYKVIAKENTEVLEKVIKLLNRNENKK